MFAGLPSLTHEQQQKAVCKEFVPRLMLPISLSFDHRVIDGVMASKFLKRIAELLENPYMLLV